MLQEIKLAAILAKTASKNPRALPAFQALQMATLGGARALGLEAEIGSLEVGKRADISIFDFSAFHLTPCFDTYSHMAYAALPSDAHSVMVDGRWLYRERKFTRLDAEEIRMEANRAAWDLVKR
jgi:5-methylthioadenosine/S-adenosylhomocysteine deaminase